MSEVIEKILESKEFNQEEMAELYHAAAPIQMSDEKYEKILQDDYEYQTLKTAILGTRILNNFVVKALYVEIAKHFNEKRRQYGPRFCGDLCHVLYQFKFWFDVKCRDRKKQFTFYKKIGEIKNEMIWISEESIRESLKILDALNIVNKEQGKFKDNSQVYTFSFNLNHPIVKLLYILEGMDAYVKANRDLERNEIIDGPIIDLNIKQEDDFINHIQNKVVKKHFESEKIRHAKLGYRLCQVGRAALLSWEGRYANLAEPTTNINKEETKNKPNNTPDKNPAFSPIEEKEKNRINGKDNEILDEKSSESLSALKPKSRGVNGGGGGALVKSAQTKWDKLNPKNQNYIKKLIIGRWKHSKRFNYTKADYEKSEKWFDSLKGPDKDLVSEFQNDMWDHFLKHSKQKSNEQMDRDKQNNTNLVDACAFNENFMQWCYKKQLIQ